MELKNYKIDDNMFAFSTNMAEAFDTLGKKNYEVVWINGVSAEVLKTSVPVILFTLNGFLYVSFVARLSPEVSKGCKTISSTQVG